MAWKSAIVLVVAFSSASLAAQPAPSPRDDRVVGEPAWLATADPAADFRHDLASGALHFIELTGQGPVLPGLGAMRRYMCYSQYAGVKVIDVGYCFVAGESDLLLRDQAYKYGEAYNAQLVSYLDRLGKNDCTAGVDWDAAWQAVNAWAGNLGPRARGTTKMGKTEVRVYLNDFKRHEAAASEVCALLQKHGLDRSFRVEVSPREYINTDRENESVYSFTCTPRHEP